MGIYGASTTSGAQAVQWADNGSNDQQWTLTAVGSNYRIVNLNSGKSLAVDQGATTDGAMIIQTDYTGTTEQQWQLVANH